MFPPKCRKHIHKTVNKLLSICFLITTPISQVVLPSPRRVSRDWRRAAAAAPTQVCVRSKCFFKGLSPARPDRQTAAGLQLEIPPDSSGDEMVRLVTHSHSQPQQQPGPSPGPMEVLLEGPGPGKVARRPKRGMARISFGVKYNPWAVADTEAGLGVGLQTLQHQPTSVTPHRALHGYGVMGTQHHRQ